MPFSPRALLVWLPLGMALAFAAVGMVRDVPRLSGACKAAADDLPVLSWRRDTPAAQDLRRFLDAARQALPRRSIVGFASPDGPAQAAFFRRLWAAYLAPDLDFVSDAGAPAHTRYILAYHLRLERRGLFLLRAWPDGGLYRIGPQ